MTKPDNRAHDARSRSEQSNAKAQNARNGEHAPGDPAAERGERTETSKTIARGGKSTGKVAGTHEQESKR